MPEGDTIHRAAMRLRRAAAGQPVRHFAAWEPRLDRRDLVGATLTQVEARGKHLLMHFDRGPSLHTHMRMRGKWRVGQESEQRPRVGNAVRIVLETERARLICSNVQMARWIDVECLPADDWLRKLGPDLLAPDFHLGTAVHRLRALSGLALGEALMHQGAVCGVGNVYKSETLFLSKLDPFAPVAHFAPETLSELVMMNRKLMTLNLVAGDRQLRFRSGGGGRVWVYGRKGEHCLRCDGEIRMRRQGAQLRSTYYCPACQGVSDES